MRNFSDLAASRTSNLADLFRRISSGGKPHEGDLKHFKELWHPVAFRSGVCSEAGNTFDFRPFMRRYAVRLRYYGRQVVYAFSKTAIRKCSAHPSYILEIEEARESVAA